MKKIIVTVFLCCATVAITAQDWIVIVNENNVATSISISDLKRLYTGKPVDVGGKEVRPANLGLDNKAAIAFIKDISGMSITEYKSFWLAEQVRGGSSAPVIQKSVEAMISFIAENPTVIGYLPADAKPQGVRILQIK